MAPVSDHPRPRHTSVAVGLVIGGAAGVVLTVAEQLAGLNSLETRRAVTDYLARPPGSGLGLEVSSALTLLRVTLMLLAGCATAAAVLGYHVLNRSHRARLGLSVLAVPIFFGGLVTGGFLTSVVASATLLLWWGPSGAWFRGEDPARATRTREPAPGRPQPPAGETAPWLEQPALLTETPEEAGPGRRPDALVWACVLTWAFSSLTLVVILASVVLLASDPALVLDELRRQNPDRDLGDTERLVTTTYLTASLAGAWSLAAVTLAVLAHRRVGWARVALQVSAAAAAVACLVAAISSLVTVVPGIVCLLTAGLLNRPEVKAWFAAGRNDRGAMRP